MRAIRLIGAAGVLSACGVVLGNCPALAAAGQPSRAPGAAILRLSTVPVVPEAQVVLDGVAYLTSATGSVTISTFAGRHKITILPPRLHRAGTAVRFSRWLDGIALASRPIYLHQGRNDEQAGFQVSHPISVRFSNGAGRPVPLSAVKRITMANSLGQRYIFAPDRPPDMLPANRIVRDRFGLYALPIRYSVRDVLFGGANVVYGGSQSFFVREHRTWTVRLLLFPMRIEVRDALFGFGVGSAVRVRLVGGSSRTVRLGSGHAVTLSGMPRATYDLVATGPGVGLSSPATLTKPLVARLLLLSWVDFAAVGAFALLFVVGLPLVGGRIKRRKDGTRLPAWHVGHPAEHPDHADEPVSGQQDWAEGPVAEEHAASGQDAQLGAASEDEDVSAASESAAPGRAEVAAESLAADEASVAGNAAVTDESVGAGAESKAEPGETEAVPVPPESDSIVRENANHELLELIPRSDVASGLSWAAATDPCTPPAAETWRQYGGQHVGAASATVSSGGSANEAVARPGIQAILRAADGAPPGDHSANGNQGAASGLAPDDLAPDGLASDGPAPVGMTSDGLRSDNLAPDDQAVTSPSAFSEEEVKWTARLAWERRSEREGGKT